MRKSRFSDEQMVANMSARRPASVERASMSTNGSAEMSAWSMQAARSNIQAGISSLRPTTEQLSEQRKMEPSAFSTVSWMKTGTPAQGWNRYTSARNPVPWVFSIVVVQRGAPAFQSGLSHPSRVRGARTPRSDPSGDGPERCGMWGLRAPARRSTARTRAHRGSNRGGRFKLSLVRRNQAGQLESENARLKKLVAERDIEIEVMKEINAKKW